MTASKTDSLGADWSPRPFLRSDDARPRKLNAFLRAQKEKLLELREALGDSVAKVTQGSRENVPEASPLGQHPADAGSDSYDRDFAFGLLSHDQDALIEIEEALIRIERGTYGICEASGEAIPRARLAAIPFARLTVARQAQLEREKKASRFRRLPQSVFGPDEAADASERARSGKQRDVEEEGEG